MVRPTGHPLPAPAAREKYSGEDPSWPWSPQEQMQWLRQGAPCTRCKYATHFEDGRKLCRRHYTDDDRAMLADLDRRGRAVGLNRAGEHDPDNSVAWPYGPNVHVRMRRALLDWAEANQLTYAGRSHACLSWLANERCPGPSRCAGQTLAVLRWLDHPSSWTGPAGLRLLVSQPYALTADDGPALQAVTAAEGLHLIIHPPGVSWYGFQTYMVLIAGFPAVAGEVAA